MEWLAIKLTALEVLVWVASYALLAVIVVFAVRGFLDWRRQRRRTST